MAKFTDSQISRIRDFLDSEICACETGRVNFENKLIENNRIYEAVPKVKEKAFPWAKASNVVVPITAIVVDAIVARIYNTIFNYPDIYTLRTLWAEGADAIMPIQKFINNVSRAVACLPEGLRTIILGSVRDGTAFGKLTWEHEERIRQKFSPWKYLVKGGYSQEKIVTFDGPRLSPIPLQDMRWPLDAMDEQTARWIGHVSRFYDFTQLKMLERAGMLQDVDKVKEDYSRKRSDHDQKRDQMEGFESSKEYKEWILHEIYMDFDHDEDGENEQIVVVYHQPTNTILRAEPFVYDHGRRPIVRFNYKKRDYRMLGEGVATATGDLQEAISSVLNQTIDNATVANTIMLGAKRHSLKEGEKLYPMKILYMDDPSKDIVPIRLGDVYNSAYQNIQLLMGLVEKRTGISDYSLGRESSAVGSAATATSTLALIQEGNKKFDLAIKDIRGGISEIGMQIFELYQQFKPMGVEVAVMGEEGRWVKETFNPPNEYMRDKLSFDVASSSSVSNKEMVRNDNREIYAFMQSYYQMMVSLTQMKNGIVQAQGGSMQVPMPPEVMAVVGEVMTRSTNIVKRILESYEIPNVDSYSLDLGGIQDEIQQGGAGVLPGGMPPGGMGDIPEMANMATGQGNAGASPLPAGGTAGVQRILESLQQR